MKVGRNDPCHCGSGKKYKKCCLQKDLAAKIENTVKINEESKEIEPINNDSQLDLGLDDIKTSEPDDVEEPEPDDPHIKASNKRWDEFDEADYEGQIALYLKTLDEKELMDDDMAFEMLARIYDNTIEKNERDRFDELVDKLQQQLPNIYDSSSGYYLKWKIINAVAANRHDLIGTLLAQYTQKAATNIDSFNNVVDMLAYHGYQTPLYKVMQEAWQFVKDSTDIVPWGIDEFGKCAADYAIFEYIDTHNKIDAHDPKLMESFQIYFEKVNQSLFFKYVDYISGNITSQWELADLNMKTKKTKENLYYLTLEFLSYLRTEEDVPFTKAELAREQFHDYFIERHKRKLVAQPSPLEQMLAPKKRKPPRQAHTKHILCPDSATLDVFFARLLNFMNPQYYKVAAVIDLIPAWLRFIESKNLADKSQCIESRGNIRRKIVIELAKIWENTKSHPGLHINLERNWEHEV